MKKLIAILALTFAVSTNAEIVERKIQVTCAPTKLVFGFLKDEKQMQPVFISKETNKALVMMWVRGNKAYITASPMNSSETCVLAELHDLELRK